MLSLQLSISQGQTMWFKQIQIYQITMPIPTSANELAKRLEPFAYHPCLPSMPQSIGWVSPLEMDGEELPLTRGLNGCFMLCLQIEEKILPNDVINNAVKDKIKHIELEEDRKVRRKEKLNIKEEMTFTLLPRAFSKLMRIYAYIDTRHQWLILNAASPKRTEQFMSLFKKSLGDGVTHFDLIKPSSVLTHWLKEQAYPDTFAIEKTCVLQDPNQENRMIRAQQQDLFADSIQALLTEGCEVIQLALCWYDKVNFVINQEFVLRGIHLAEDDVLDGQDEIETKAQKFDADLVMMAELLAGLINDLLKIFVKAAAEEKALAPTGS